MGTSAATKPIATIAEGSIALSRLAESGLSGPSAWLRFIPVLSPPRPNSTPPRAALDLRICHFSGKSRNRGSRQDISPGDPGVPAPGVRERLGSEASPRGEVSPGSLRSCHARCQIGGTFEVGRDSSSVRVIF
jgi:hypothetical protein